MPGFSMALPLFSVRPRRNPRLVSAALPRSTQVSGFLLPEGATERSGRVRTDSDTALLVVEGIGKIAGAIMVSH